MLVMPLKVTIPCLVSRPTGMTHSTASHSNSIPTAWLWQNPQLADVLLEVHFTDHACGETVGLSWTEQYFLHSQIIGSHSEFFHASLVSPVGAATRDKSPHSNNDTYRWNLSAKVDAGHAKAVTAALRFFYKSNLSDDLQGSELLKIIQASHWQLNTSDNLVVGQEGKKKSDSMSKK